MFAFDPQAENQALARHLAKKWWQIDSQSRWDSRERNPHLHAGMWGRLGLGKVGCGQCQRSNAEPFAWKEREVVHRGSSITTSRLGCL
jgi:hypothetical protein